MLIGLATSLLDYSPPSRRQAVQLLVLLAQYGSSLGLHRSSVFDFWARNDVCKQVEVDM